MRQAQGIFGPRHLRLLIAEAKTMLEKLNGAVRATAEPVRT